MGRRLDLHQAFLDDGALAQIRVVVGEKPVDVSLSPVEAGPPDRVGRDDSLPDVLRHFHRQQAFAPVVEDAAEVAAPQPALMGVGGVEPQVGLLLQPPGTGHVGETAVDEVLPVGAAELERVAGLEVVFQVPFR